MKNYPTAMALALIAVTTCCKKPYQAPQTTLNVNYLVVEGLINSSDSSFIKLSRTVLINNKTGTKAEKGAVVSIESDASASYPLQEKADGSYITPPLNLNATKKYRLRIRTTTGKIYLSDFVPVKPSPPIDSISWQAKENGVQVYANTHDPNNLSRYYRWDFAETWMFHSQYKSLYISNGTSIVDRDLASNDIYTCWTGLASNNVEVSSSVKLAKDVIYQAPVAFIPSSSEKIGIKYSILVRQYALTKEGYDFWETLKKNTEQLGSIFDAQPSQLTGNIHNVADSQEPVIGFISAGTVEQQRIFITATQLPKWQTLHNYVCFGNPDSVFLKNPRTGASDELTILVKAKSLIPLDAILAPGSDRVIGHTAAPATCVDCTVKGTNKKPAFWQ